MTALEVKDIETQIEMLLDRYQSTESKSGKYVLEECLAANLGAIEYLVLRGDVKQEDYEHCQVLVYLITAKVIEPIKKQETIDEKEDRLVKLALKNYAERWKESNIVKKTLTDQEVLSAIKLLASSGKREEYWDYYEKMKR